MKMVVTLSTTISLVLALIVTPLPQCSSFQPVVTTSSSRRSANQFPSATKFMATISDSDTKEEVVYSLSQKKDKLIEEATRLNVSKGSYAPIGWSNRYGSVITPASIPGVYTADRPFHWNNIDVGGRMTIIQLQSTTTSTSEDDASPELVVHSPVNLDPPLIEALAKLGTVTHVISPNYEHVKYAKQWSEYYPDAKIWGCPGLMEREPDTRWSGEIPFGARPPGFTTKTTASTESASKNDNEMMWDWNELQPLHIDTEVNPFTGKSFFNEVIFYHAPSKSLLTTDVYWNYPRGDGVTNGQVFDELTAKGISVDANNEEDFGVWELAPNVGEIPFGSKLWGKVGMDKLFHPFYMNLMVKSDKRDEFEEISKYITGGNRGSCGWQVETIIPCHGDIIRGKELCRKVLETHFNV